MEAAALAGEFNGAPTAISQRWPGWPCAGFNPAATVVLFVLVVIVAVFVEGVLVGAFDGVEFSGAPTAISHLWPGCP